MVEICLPASKVLIEPRTAATLSLLNPFAPTYRALLTLVREKPLGAAFAASGKFLPAGVKNGAALERSSLLGPFLAPSCFFPANSRVLSECFTELAQPQARDTALAPPSGVWGRMSGSLGGTSGHTSGRQAAGARELLLVAAPRAADGPVRSPRHRQGAAQEQ